MSRSSLPVSVAQTSAKIVDQHRKSALAFFGALALTLSLMGALGLFTASAVTRGGFEIDASQVNPDDALFAGETTGGQAEGVDWAEDAGSPGDSGLFAGVPTGDGAPGAFTVQVAIDCYGSDVYADPSIGGLNVFICDGNADAKFGNGGGAIIAEPELSVVSPSGKQQDTVWPITSGNVPGKNDFSHAYFRYQNTYSECQEEVAPQFTMAAHRGGNEGDAFWGFD